MQSTTTLLDPTAELQSAARQLLPRLQSIAGATVGLLDISKPRGKEFLDEVQKHFGTPERLRRGCGSSVMR